MGCENRGEAREAWRDGRQQSASVKEREGSSWTAVQFEGSPASWEGLLFSRMDQPWYSYLGSVASERGGGGFRGQQLGVPGSDAPLSTRFDGASSWPP